MKPVGGRGKTAPYISTHVRVPIPVKHIIELVIDKYRERLDKGEVKPGVIDDISEYFSDKSDGYKPLTSYEDISNVIRMLSESLNLKSNAGGAIKEEIRKALEILKG